MTVNLFLGCGNPAKGLREIVLPLVYESIR
jgi:hypothetical protein